MIRSPSLGRTLMIRSPHAGAYPNDTFPPTALVLLQVNFARGLVGPLVISAAGIITSTAQVATKQELLNEVRKYIAESASDLL